MLKFEEYPDPVAGPGEVLVQIAATGVNPIDYKRRAGLMKGFYPINFPGLMGVDIAGLWSKLGPVWKTSLSATRWSQWRPAPTPNCDDDWQRASFRYGNCSVRDTR